MSARRSIPPGSRYEGADDDCGPEQNFEQARDLEHDQEDELVDGVGFAEPGGRSALRAASRSNPRVYPCPTCRRPNLLTPLDRQRGYQCDSCADSLEGWGP